MNCPIARFIRAAPLPLAFTLLSLALCCLLAVWGIRAGSGGSLLSGAGWLLSASFCLSVAGCSLADGLCRYHEYLRFKRILLRYGFRTRLFLHLSRSRCQRDAILLAAHEAECRHLLQDLFRRKGYRWYHILPDPIVDNPLHFFKPEFLRTTFLPGKRSAQ